MTDTALATAAQASLAMNRPEGANSMRIPAFDGAGRAA